MKASALCPLRLDALLYFPVLIVGGMCTLGGLAWLYEKTRKKIVHPRLGTMTRYDNGWVALLPHYTRGERSVRVELPGGKSGPDPEPLERFEALWSDVAQAVARVRPYALQALEDDGNADENAEIQALMERSAGDLTRLDEDWILSGVSLYQGERGRQYWYLEFDVSWDVEHQRAAYLDLDGCFLRYDLSCSVVDL